MNVSGFEMTCMKIILFIGEKLFIQMIELIMLIVRSKHSRHSQLQYELETVTNLLLGFLKKTIRPTGLPAATKLNV